MSQTAGITFEILSDGTDEHVLTLQVFTPEGELQVMAELEENGSSLTARGLHIHGVGIGANDLGLKKLKDIARKVMEEMGYDELVVEGAHRTSGANPGHKPRTVRITR